MSFHRLSVFHFSNFHFPQLYSRVSCWANRYLVEHKMPARKLNHSWRNGLQETAVVSRCLFSPLFVICSSIVPFNHPYQHIFPLPCWEMGKGDCKWVGKEKAINISWRESLSTQNAKVNHLTELVSKQANDQAASIRHPWQDTKTTSKQAAVAKRAIRGTLEWACWYLICGCIVWWYDHWLQFSSRYWQERKHHVAATLTAAVISH